mgnify:CR=1 FL=1
MNLAVYQRLLADNKAVVNNYRQNYIKNILFHCTEAPTSKLQLFHGTSNENANKILQDGFKIEKFSGTQPMGVGVYLTPDSNLARYFGNAILAVDVKLKSSLVFTYNALKNFKFLQDEFFDKMLKIISESKNVSKDKTFKAKILRQMEAQYLPMLAKNRGISPKQLAIQNAFKEETTAVFSNLIADVVDNSGYTSLHTYDDIYGGINGRPMNQWILMNLNEIVKVKSTELK